MHLTWLTRDALTARTIYYAELQGRWARRAAACEGAKAGRFYLSRRGDLLRSDPWRGREQCVRDLVGAEPGRRPTPTSAFSFYVTFALGAFGRAWGAGSPDTVPGHSGRCSAQVCGEVVGRESSAYGLAELVPLSSRASGGSDFVNSPATVSSQRAELPVALSVLTRSRADSQIRLATAALSGGKPVGYQLASKSLTASLMPSIAADSVDRGGRAAPGLAGHGGL